MSTLLGQYSLETRWFKSWPTCTRSRSVSI